MSLRQLSILNLCLLVFCMAISSCFDKPSKSELLKSGKWQLVEYINYPGLGSQPIDMYSVLPSCEKDNFYIFGSNDTGELNEGLTKCSATAPQEIPFYWKLGEDGTLNFDGKVWKVFISETELGINTVKHIGGKGDLKTFVKF